MLSNLSPNRWQGAECFAWYEYMAGGKHRMQALSDCGSGIFLCAMELGEFYLKRELLVLS